MNPVQQLFAVERGDRPQIALLGPLFAVTSACSVVVACVSKTLFLQAHKLEHLPWIFLGSGAFTALASLAYVASMNRFSLTKRFVFLLASAFISFSALVLAFPGNPAFFSLVIIFWCPSLGHLIIVQTWNTASSTLPTRQGKRLFPLLAAFATIGAVGGGLFVKFLMDVDGVQAKDLIWFAVFLILFPLATITGVVRRLTESVGGEAAPAQAARAETRPMSRPAPENRSEIRQGIEGIIKSPLLLRLSVFVFVLQAASVLIDYQFSGEIQQQYASQPGEMARFLGNFYWVSNLLVLVLTLFATGPMVQNWGIGPVLAGGAFFMGLGSCLYLGEHFFDPAFAFWMMAFTAFADRVCQYALTKNAMQMLVTPLDAKAGERAKTLIDGVVYRASSILVSVFLLIFNVEVADLFMISPVVVVACVVVVFVSLGIGPHFREAIFAALQSRDLDISVAPYLKGGFGPGAAQETEEHLASEDPLVLLKALDVVSELRLPVRQELLENLVRTDNATIAKRSLETMKVLERRPSPEFLVEILNVSRPAPLLRAAIQILPYDADKQVHKAVAALKGHPDASVGSLATVFEIRAFSEGDGAAGETKSVSQMNIRALGFYEELVAMLEDTSLEVRFSAIDSMGELRMEPFLDPLIGCLSKGDLRPRAVDALCRFGPKLVGAAAHRFHDSGESLVTRTWLVKVLELLDDPAALELLMEQAESSQTAVRDAALASLWRKARDPDSLQVSRDWAIERARIEIDLVKSFTAVEVSVALSGLRRRFFISELNALRVQGETRVFRLLGLIYPRAVMYRAYLHYRSANRRTRSNAIELLDQHLKSPAHKDFVALVEREESADGALVPKIGAYLPEVHEGQVGELLRGTDRWLSRVWSWAQEGGGDDAGQFTWQDPMERVVLLKEIPLFSGMSGEQILPVVEIVKQERFSAGATIFNEGDDGDRLYLVMRGWVDVIRNGERLVTLGKKECFGEMALLDSEGRSASVVAKEDSLLLTVGKTDFQDLLDLHPALARGIISVLCSRLRSTG